VTASAVSPARARIAAFNLLATAIAAGGTLAVAVVLVLNLRRLDPILSSGTAAIVSVYLWRSWVAHGRPGGIPRVAT
jgi:hypothetical protein